MLKTASTISNRLYNDLKFTDNGKNKKTMTVYEQWSKQIEQNMTVYEQYPIQI